MTGITVSTVLWIALFSGIGTAGEMEQPVFQRIISLAPSLTETVYALGMEDRLVGVTSYCHHPPEARQLPQVGGMLDTHYEAIVALRPDLVLTILPQDEQRRRLGRFNLATCTIPQDTTQDILDSILTLGRLGRVDDKADALVEAIRDKFDRVHRSVAGHRRPRTLIVIGRDYESDTIGQVFIASRNDFLSQLVEAAGGRPLWVESAIVYPSLSREGLIRLNPEVILDLAPGRNPDSANGSSLLDSWHRLSGIEAVKNDRVHVMTADYLAIPGPRIVHTLEALVRAIHPEIEIP